MRCGAIPAIAAEKEVIEKTDMDLFRNIIVYHGNNCHMWSTIYGGYTLVVKPQEGLTYGAVVASEAKQSQLVDDHWVRDCFVAEVAPRNDDFRVLRQFLYNRQVVYHLWWVHNSFLAPNNPSGDDR